MNIEKHRKIWEEVAKNNGWYQNPFFVQIWINKETNEIMDSVSFVGLKQDLIVDYNTEEVIND